MAFKEGKASFSEGPKFTDAMKNFISEEAAFFTPEKDENATASMDKTAEKIIRYEASKNKAEATKLRSEVREKEAESRLSPKAKKSTSGEDKFSDGSGEKFTEERSGKRAKERKEPGKKESKAASKETKKAAAKTAVANLLKAKGDVSGDLGSEKVTGDAMRDGNRGLMKAFTTAINPMTYVKTWLAGLTAMVAPYILIFMAIAAVLVVILCFIFSIAKPIADVGNALQSVMEFFTGEDGGIRNTALSQDEIDEIVANSGADKTQEKAIRFSLSKVSMPYSQDLRTSGKAYDCSSLCYYAWRDAGVDISFGSGYPPTAAEGARMLQANGKEVSADSLQPGDLIYYGGKANGRFMGIYHVAMYVGNGMAAEAYSTKYGVIYQKLRTKNACMVCRPNL
jgi:cell wall-associated NlpC family hydrolase